MYVRLLDIALGHQGSVHFFSPSFFFVMAISSISLIFFLLLCLIDC